MKDTNAKERKQNYECKAQSINERESVITQAETVKRILCNERNTNLPTGDNNVMDGKQFFYQVEKYVECKKQSTDRNKQVCNLQRNFTFWEF